MASHNSHTYGDATVTGNARVQFGDSYRILSKNEVDNACLRALRCPNSLVIKNRLKDKKDKVLRQSFDWILRDAQYISWQDGENVGLLWIKGGAGKGKTMMSIGLVEELAQRPKDTTLVTYFFCQNADSDLNTIEAVIKGLIFQLVRQQESLKQALWERWDSENQCFTEDVSSWRGLWDIFMEMLELCTCPRVYVLVDALDECQKEGMADLLQAVVRTGLSRPARVKWLLVSRPLDIAQQKLLVGNDQLLVSLELNVEHVSQGVQAYITHKVDELDRWWSPDTFPRDEIERELCRKAQGTFLWVHLVCRRLEDVSAEDALTTIQSFRPGLNDIYRRAFTELCYGKRRVMQGCIHLLKVMMLTFQPLNVHEVSNVAGLPDDQSYLQMLIDRCASFVQKRGAYVEFLHQSARDYLSGDNGPSPLDVGDDISHAEIGMNCLAHLSKQLKANLLDCPQPGATRETVLENMQDGRNELLSRLDYAATFFVRHLAIAKERSIVQHALADNGVMEQFLRTHFLEWLECLCLLDQLPSAVGSLRTLADLSSKVARFDESDQSSSLFAIVKDATRFLWQHHGTISRWPLQAYSSAIVFSPIKSEVRASNIARRADWLVKTPAVEMHWMSLIYILVGHSDWVNAVAFSPDGQYIVSGSDDQTIKVWDATTGEVQTTLVGHSNCVKAVAFSPNGQYIVSGSDDQTIKVWDATTGEVQTTLVGHSRYVNAVAFSPDGQHIISGSDDQTIKVWDATTGEVQTTLVGHSDCVNAVALSPDGQHIISGSDDRTIKVWDTTTGEVQTTLVGHSNCVNAVAFSPDGQHIVSGSYDQTIKVWDATTGEVQTTLVGHSDCVNAVAFSPDGQHIVSGSDDQTIKVWDATTGEVQTTLVGHSDCVNAVVLSPDGQHIISGSNDQTIKVWDTTTGEVQTTLVGHSDCVNAVALSSDGQHIISGSNDQTIKVWDTTTGEVQTTLVGHSDWVNAVAFSPHGQHIVSGSYDRTIKVWDATTGEVQTTLVGHSNWVKAVAFSPDGQHIVSGSYDRTIKVWDATTGEVQTTLVGHSDCVNAVAFSPDGQHIVSGSYDRTIKVWDATTGEVQTTLVGHSNWVKAVAFSPDGQHIVSGSYDQTIKVWDASTGDVEKTLLGDSAMVSLVAFQSGGPRIIPESEECLRCLQVHNGWVHYGQVPVLRVRPDLKVECFCQNGDQFALGLTNGQVLIFTIDCGSLLSVFNA